MEIIKANLLYKLLAICKKKVYVRVPIMIYFVRIQIITISFHYRDLVLHELGW